MNDTNKSNSQIRENIEKYRIIDAFGDGVSIQDTDLNILYQNNVHKKIIGDHQGESCYKAYENREQVCGGCPVVESFRDGEIHTTERTATTDKGKITVEITASPLRDSKGTIIAGIEIIRDITERKRIAEELKFRSEITEQLNASVITTGLDFKITWVNHAFSSLYGYSADEVIGQTPDFLNCDPMSEQIQNDIYQTVSSGGIWIGEAMNRRRDGTTFLCELDIFSLKDENENIFAFAGHQRDITKRKKAEQDRERLNVELAQKNRELEQVVYVTSHDLRTPLVNIDGYNKEIGKALKELGRILESDGVSEEVREKIDVIIGKDIPQAENYITASVSKMDALLSGLLQISRLGRLDINREKLDMNEIVSEILETINYQVENAGARIEASKLPSCSGDKNQMNQLFSNLIDNALKYLDSSRSGVISVSGKKEGDYSVYCVEDNGIGISPDHYDKIFEIFNQLKPKQSTGEGLGLTIVKKIVDIHYGKIWLESKPGTGSKFYVSLPNR